MGHEVLRGAADSIFQVDLCLEPQDVSRLLDAGDPQIDVGGSTWDESDLRRGRSTRTMVLARPYTETTARWLPMLKDSPTASSRTSVRKMPSIMSSM